MSTRSLVIATAVLLTPGLGLASVLIPIPDRIDHVFDPTRQILYISTSTGEIQRYDLASGRLLDPFFVNGAPGGIDITPDGAWVYVTEALWGPNEGFLRKIDAGTGAVTNITYDLDRSEAGSFDVAIGSHGLGLMTTAYDGSAGVALRTVDLTNDAITARDDVGLFGEITDNSHVYRSADRSTIFLLESYGSTPMHLYDAATGSFIASSGLDFDLWGWLAALSRDGSMLALTTRFDGVAIVDRSFTLVQTLDVASAGVLFDPVRDRLYVTDYQSDALVAFDTLTWALLKSWDVGEDLLNRYYDHEGVMSASDDGHFVFLSTEQGIRVISVVPVPPSIWLLASALASFAARNRRRAERGLRKSSTLRRKLRGLQCDGESGALAALTRCVNHSA